MSRSPEANVPPSAPPPASPTVAAFFGVGVGKGLVVAQTWWRSAMETVVVGGTAAALAYAVGVALGGIG